MAKVFFSLLAGCDSMLVAIKRARCCCYFLLTFEKILKTDSVMVGNNLLETARMMDLPAGWQFILAMQLGCMDPLHQIFLSRMIELSL